MWARWECHLVDSINSGVVPYQDILIKSSKKITLQCSSQLVFTFSKLIIETLEQGVKYVQS